MMNTTLYMYIDSFSNVSHHYRGRHQYSTSLVLHGTQSQTFIPEDEIIYDATYLFGFDLPSSLGSINFAFVVKQYRCGYFNEHHKRWEVDGCKVSPKSNDHQTVCLCNHL
ncbi:polycystin-1-like protein 2 [Glandiceps talaboti]